MKCPYCNKEMWHPIGKPTWSCQNWSCMESEGMIGNHVLWQALIDTRKALDVAVNGLEKMTWGCDSSDAEHLLKEIKQITAQEQKEEK